MLHFFQQMDALRENDALDNDLARRLFGRTIRYWHVHAHAHLAAGMAPSSERYELIHRFDPLNHALGEPPLRQSAAADVGAGKAQPSWSHSWRQSAVGSATISTHSPL